MSCFVVDKASYAKAAGIVAGIADTANVGSRARFWLYDGQKNRNMAGTDYLDAFLEVYEMNVRSVSESWNEELHPESGDCMEDFKRGVKTGKKAYYHRWENGGYLRVIQELRYFFSGVMYQIDNPELEQQVSNFLNGVTVELMKQLDPDGEHESWGSLDLATFDKILTDSEENAKWIVSRALGI